MLNPSFVRRHRPRPDRPGKPDAKAEKNSFMSLSITSLHLHLCLPLVLLPFTYSMPPSRGPPPPPWPPQHSNTAFLSSKKRKMGPDPKEGRRSRGRRKVIWRDGITADLQGKGVTEDDARDRNNWRRLVRGANTSLQGNSQKRRSVQCSVPRPLS